MHQRIAGLVFTTLAAVVTVSSATEKLRDLPLEYCQHGGMLKDGVCECTLAYEGRMCEFEKCLNGGRIHGKPGGKVRCHCPFGLTGERCENATYCTPGQGTLKDGKCVCEDRFAGIFCERRVCHNGIPTGGMDILCVCDIGYTGVYCDEVRMCGRGEVNQQNECDCEEGWSAEVGESCDRCAPGYHMEGEECVPEVSGQSLLLGGGASSAPFWPLLIVGCAAAAVVLAVGAAAGIIFKRLHAKPSRVNSATPVDGTDV